MMDELELRNQLVSMLTVRQAHMDFEDAVADFPADYINVTVPNGDYSFWHLLEHMRICQRDILEYMESDNYSWPNFPDDLWPDKTTETDLAGWQETITQFIGDRHRLVDIIDNPDVNLFAPLPNSGEHRHNIVREINVIANHNAYHTGELAILRQVMQLWS